MVRTANNRDQFRAFYTNSRHITDYMVARLELQHGLSVFDPCAGGGALTDAVLDSDYNVEVFANELDPKEAEKLSKRYSKPNKKVTINPCDTLLESSDGLSSQPQKFDRIIANPPYGAWQDYERRKLLKRLFPGLYVKETYSLFLFKCLDLLKDEGRLVFITPDTYLNLHLHKKLRARLLTQTAIEEIVIFPSDFFPSLSFKYANLSIVSLRKTNEVKSSLSHTVKIIKGLKNPSDLSNLAIYQTQPTYLEVIRAPQHLIYKDSDHAFLVNFDQNISNTVRNSSISIGDVADVVTGFYSGDDKMHLRRASETVRRGKRYELVDPERTSFCSTKEVPPMEGISGTRCFIPMVKGGARRYVKPNDWFIDWSTEAVLDYRIHSKKARFQNPKFYFREGLAVPMVSSSRISAALLNSRLFDQSIVGVFPRDPSLTLYLLGFFNSDICNSLIRTINPSANNSANYIKKLPFKMANSEQKARVEFLVQRMIDEINSTDNYSKSHEEEMNKIFKNLYGSAI